MSQIKRFTIYGERSSGTNYLEKLININFDIPITWDYGFKHFFGFEDFKNSDDVLFICIVRNITDWMNSLFKHGHNLEKDVYSSKENFLNNHFITKYDSWDSKRYYGNKSHIFGQDLNLITKQTYKNVFELRHTKLHYLNEILPKLVKNIIIIRHEDLIYNFNETMDKIKNKGLIVKKDIDFPVNSNLYSGPYEGDGVWKQKNRENYKITPTDIFLNKNFIPEYEEKYKYYPKIFKLYKNLSNNLKHTQKNLIIEKENTNELNQVINKLQTIVNEGINKVLANNIENYKLEIEVLKKKLKLLENNNEKLN